PLAFVLARRQFPLKAALTVLVELPIVMPPVVAGLALLLAFGRQGILGGPLSDLGIQITFTPIAVVLAQVFVASPFYIRAAQIQFRSIPMEIIEAAEIDGATGYRSMRKVFLPLSWRALLAGFLLSWARALGEFGATILFAGNLQGSTQTMPLLVYAALEQNIDAAITTGLILIGSAALSMGVVQFLVGRSEFAEDSEPNLQKTGIA
ncbi:MAG: ABC transporter permease, partial [Anaerolineales bacterium]